MGSKTFETFFDARDGIKLFYRVWLPAEPRRWVAILHGLAEHSGRYGHVADALNAAGFAVAALDYRGHGQAGGRRTHIDRFGDYLGDAERFLQELVPLGGGQRPILLGHSQGGLIALRFAQTRGENLDGLILSSPFLGIAMPIPTLKSWAGRWVSKLWPTFSMHSGLDPLALSHDREMVERYIADPLISNTVSARWFTEILEAHRQSLADAGRLRLPLLALLGGEDRIVSQAAIRTFFAQVASADKQLREYPGLFHELFNETERRQVLVDVLDWLDARFPGPTPSEIGSDR